jgi:cell wall-associated NlpC family hydrolase
MKRIILSILFLFFIIILFVPMKDYQVVVDEVLRRKANLLEKMDYDIVYDNGSSSSYDFDYDYSYFKNIEPPEYHFEVKKRGKIILDGNSSKEVSENNASKTKQDVKKTPKSSDTKKTKQSKQSKIRHDYYGEKYISKAKKLLGLRYVWGGESPRRGLDCSAFCRYVFGKNVLPRTSAKQFKSKKLKKVSLKNAKPGDLIFFGTRHRYVGHVGIIIDPKRKLMIHASSAKGKVVIGSYATRYFKRKFRGVRRINNV